MNRHQKRAERAKYLRGKRPELEQAYREWCALRLSSGKSIDRRGFNADLRLVMAEQEGASR